MWKLLARLSPLLSYLQTYRSQPRALRSDLIAGISVGVMLVPQCMAYAVLAGLPPVVGLMSSIVPLILFALTARTPHVAFGVMALDMLILAGGLSRVAEPGQERYVMLAIVVTVLVGLLELLIAAARLDFLVNFLSRPVIIGFSTAAPILIAMSQLGNLTGLQEYPGSANLQRQLGFLINNLQEIELATLLLGGGSIALMFILRRISRQIPNAVIIVVLGGLLAWGLNLPEQGVALLGDIDASLQAPSWPRWTMEELRELFGTIMTLALIQVMTLTSLTRTFAARANTATEPRRDIAAMGLANALGGFFGGAPGSGSFSRSALNWEAQAATPLNNLFAALVVLLSVLLLAPLLSWIPQPSLGAIIIVAALGIIRPRDFLLLWRIKRADSMVALLTTATTLLIGIQEGVLLGVGATMALMIWRQSRPKIAALGREPGTDHYRDLDFDARFEAVDHVLILRVDAELNFVNADYVKDTLLDEARKIEDLQLIVLDGRGINAIDATAIATLHELLDALESNELPLVLVHFKAKAREILRRGGILARLQEPDEDPDKEPVHHSLHEALEIRGLAPLLTSEIERLPREEE